jgi:hypothetical protein
MLSRLISVKYLSLTSLLLASTKAFYIDFSNIPLEKNFITLSTPCSTSVHPVSFECTEEYVFNELIQTTNFIDIKYHVEMF